MRRILRAALTTRELAVLTRRYGLDGGEPQTLARIGAALGVTRERVRQIERLALDTVRQSAVTGRLG